MAGPPLDEDRGPGRARRVWGVTWRMLLGVLLGAGAALGTYVTPDEGARPVLPTQWWVWDVVLGVVAAVLYTRRHRDPLLLCGLVIALASVSVSSSGFATLALVSLATRRRWLEVTAGSALFFCSSLVNDRLLVVSVEPGENLQSVLGITLGFSLVTTALLAVTGLFIGGRRALVASRREQAQTLRREADVRAESARASERNRIAREMHDVLAHRLSLVALHAGALEYRAELDPDQVRETAAVVRESAHAALVELREVLGLLRDTDSTEELSRPQPTFAQVGELVAGTRAAGAPVALVLDRVGEDDLARLPVSTSRHMYRVMQETLTNASKHAPGAPVHVRVHGTPGERIGIEVRNPVPDRPLDAPLPSSGWGLTGLAERLRLTGGELDVERRPDGMFVVNAWLPWAASTEVTA